MSQIQIYNILLSIIPLIFAITLHEVAHGWVAKKFGDLTAYSQGRLSLNPIVHIDPIGTILLPMLSLLLGGILFGWAKPVPVHFGNLRNPRLHSIYVAAAGPAANLVMAIGWFAIGYIGISLFKDVHDVFIGIVNAGIVVNISFMIFNLIPILPLDGGRIVQGLLPTKLAHQFSVLEEYGLYIVMVLAFTGVLGKMLVPMVTWMSSPLTGLLLNM